MEDKNIGDIFQEWLFCRKNTPEVTIEEFVCNKYMEFHNSGEPEKQKEAFGRLVREWEKSEREFEEYVNGYPDSPELELWQGTEMLENVIMELELDAAEKFHYILNVRQLIYHKLLSLMDKESSEKLRTVLEQEYEEKWEKARQQVTDSEFQDLFSETVSLMRYAGLAYDDETRRVLAEIGVGWKTEFKQGSMNGARKDVRFLMNFLILEMIVSENGLEYRGEEQYVMTEQVVPVCVSAASMIQAGESPDHTMKLAYSYLGRFFTGKNIKLLVKVAAILMASKVLFFLFNLAVLGSAARIGLENLWSYCGQTLNLNLKGDFLKPFLHKARLENIQKQETGIPEDSELENPKELTYEEVYEDA